jgi:hypothetical protein
MNYLSSSSILPAMTPLHVVQSLPICCSLAAMGGILEVGATALTAIPSVREKEGIQMTWTAQFAALAGNITLQAAGSLFSHLIATWYGPVSIVVPFFYSATLLSNMFIFGLLIKQEFTKNMRVGTYVIVVAVILLPVVGPNVQEDQDVGVLMKHWYSITWFIFIILASFSAGLFLVFFDIMKYSQRERTIILLIARAASITVNLTVSRSFILGPSHFVFVLFIIIKIITGAIYTYAIVVQSTAVEQARFVPLNATTVILVNALTGVIIWEDWRVVASWYGYMCVFLLLGLGCDLLLSVPLLNRDNAEFGATNKRASLLMMRRKMAGTRKLQNSPKGGYHQVPDVEGLETDEDREGELSRQDAWRETISPRSGHGGSTLSEFDMGDEGSDSCLSTKEARKEAISPFSFGSETIERMNQSAQTPKRMGRQIATTAAKLGHQGKQILGAALQKGGVDQDEHSQGHLSRKEAWKQTISPVKLWKGRDMRERSGTL